MPVASDYNSYTSQKVPGWSLAGGGELTVDGPCDPLVLPAGRITAVLIDSEGIPITTPVVVVPGGSFNVPAGAHARLSALDPWGAVGRFNWS